jgi:hypothetical protein
MERVLLQECLWFDDSRENWEKEELEKWIETGHQKLILKKPADGEGKKNRYHLTYDFLHPACMRKETSYLFLLVVPAETGLADVAPR